MAVTRITVVDDDEEFLEQVVEILRDENYIVASHRQLPAAETIMTEETELLLLDLWLDGNQSVEWAATVSQQSPDLPIVLMSSDEQVIREFTSPLFRAVLCKPFSVEGLLSLLRQI